MSTIPTTEEAKAVQKFYAEAHQNEGRTDLLFDAQVKQFGSWLLANPATDLEAKKEEYLRHQTEAVLKRKQNKGLT